MNENTEKTSKELVKRYHHWDARYCTIAYHTSTGSKSGYRGWQIAPQGEALQQIAALTHWNWHDFN
jgi:hypothetical protein